MMLSLLPPALTWTQDLYLTPPRPCTRRHRLSSTCLRTGNESPYSTLDHDQPSRHKHRPHLRRIGRPTVFPLRALMLTRCNNSRLTGLPRYYHDMSLHCVTLSLKAIEDVLALQDVTDSARPARRAQTLFLKAMCDLKTARKQNTKAKVTLQPACPCTAPANIHMHNESCASKTSLPNPWQ